MVTWLAGYDHGCVGGGADFNRVGGRRDWEIEATRSGEILPWGDYGSYFRSL